LSGWVGGPHRQDLRLKQKNTIKQTISQMSYICPANKELFTNKFKRDFEEEKKPHSDNRDPPFDYLRMNVTY
jgi:hypothetical protein